MWKRTIKRQCLFVVCLFLLCLPLAGYCSDTTVTQEPQQVTMQLSQYNRLKEIISQQDMTLTNLQVKLDWLKKNSTNQSTELTQLQTQLTSCKTQLMTTNEHLTSANSSLATAEETLKKQEKSLQTLTAQIKQLEHHASVLQRQRDMWAVGCVALAGIVIHDKIT